MEQPLMTYHIYCFAEQPDPHEVRRPTGVKDRTGREIHEGDIVEYYDGLWEVRPCGKEYGLVNPENDDILVRSFRELLINSQIVGSVYEDPLAE